MANSSDAQAAAAILASTEAQLFVADIPAACGFYVRKLGFTVGFTYGDPPFYALVVRDRARRCLRRVCEPVFVGDIRDREQLLAASITVASEQAIRTLFAAFSRAGVDFQ